MSDGQRGNHSSRPLYKKQTGTEENLLLRTISELGGQVNRSHPYEAMQKFCIFIYRGHDSCAVQQTLGRGYLLIVGPNDSQDDGCALHQPNKHVGGVGATTVDGKWFQIGAV